MKGKQPSKAKQKAIEIREELVRLVEKCEKLKLTKAKATMKVLYNAYASVQYGYQDPDLPRPIGLAASSMAKALAEEIGWYFGLEVHSDSQLDKQFLQQE